MRHFQYPGSPRQGTRGLSMVVGSCLALLLAACGGSSMSTSSPTASFKCTNCGAAVVSMTDAAGDFLSYIVTVTSLQLQTASGASVETVTTPMQVDFTKLVDLTEIISAGQIPAADYVSATLTLSYAKAQITAQNSAGTSVTLAPVDSKGNALTGSLTVSVMLDNTNQLVITPGNTGRLAFDFNLAASNMVNLTAMTVQVSPTLVATVESSGTKQARVRGSLASTSTTGSDFVLNVQPFNTQSGTTGTVTADVTSTTTYQVNGKAYVGAAGLTALAALPADTMVAAFGSLATTGTTPVFTATNVLAGTSLQNPAKDQISGTVIARSADTLTVRGGTWTHHDGSFDFEHMDSTVTVGTATGVTEEGQMGTFTIADISVGQHITAFGMASQAANGAVTVDATAGEVQLNITPLLGTITTLATGSATINLQSIGGLPASDFTFTGTGASTATDAVATAYVVNTGTLSQTGLAAHAPVRAFGFVTPFGMAPPDFTAETLENFSAVPSVLVVSWGQNGSATALTGLTATSTSLQLSLTNVGMEHFVTVGPELVDLTKVTPAPSIVPDTAATNAVFTIGHAGKLKAENFSTFAAFVTQLETELAATTTTTATTVDIVAAEGTYNSTTDVLTAQRLAVLLSN
jgi:hypothetical protein